MMDPKGQMNAPYAKTADDVVRLPTARVVPILDDSEARSASDFVWAETQVNWERVAEHRQQALDDLTGEYHALEGELSDALMWRDILWPIGFFAGVLCGIGFQWFV